LAQKPQQQNIVQQHKTSNNIFKIDT